MNPTQQQMLNAQLFPEKHLDPETQWHSKCLRGDMQNKKEKKKHCLLAKSVCREKMYLYTAVSPHRIAKPLQPRHFASSASYSPNSHFNVSLKPQIFIALPVAPLTIVLHQPQFNRPTRKCSSETSHRSPKSIYICISCISGCPTGAQRRMSNTGQHFIIPALCRTSANPWWLCCMALSPRAITISFQSLRHYFPCVG